MMKWASKACHFICRGRKNIFVSTESSMKNIDSRTEREDSARTERLSRISSSSEQRAYFSDLCDLVHVDQGQFSDIFIASYQGQIVIVKTARVEVCNGEKATETEIGILSQLSHPHIIQMITHGCLANGTRQKFIIFEKMNESLQGRINNDHARFQPEQNILERSSFLQTVIMYATMLSRGLMYLHEQAHPKFSVIHRDLKPDNILFKDGQLKIIDFGLAIRSPKPKVSSDTFTMTGETGTPRYMAPEVFQGAYNHLIDVYSFALVLWMMLQNEKPYQQYDKESFQKAVLVNHERPPLKEWWPPLLCDLLRNCWSNDVSRRPNFCDILIHLEDILKETMGMNV